ncbi:MAG: prephenate dehydrogenase/arogenate dehydrogenase family protein [Desulfobacterales bacterium]|jgi:prephenate dehydrogenase
MIGVIGFGRFGALAVRYLAQDCRVFVCSRSQPKAAIEAVGATKVSLDEACAQSYLILCVPISAMQETLVKIAPRLAQGTVVIDVCSVKEYPMAWMHDLLPKHARILGTHPMFGPDSAANALKGCKIVLCNDSADDGHYRKIVDYLVRKELEVIEATPEEHDRQIAISLSLTHFIGRSLADFGAAKLDIDTEGYRRLTYTLEVVENDTWQLFQDMHRFNPYAREIREDFMAAMGRINERLER